VTATSIGRRAVARTREVEPPARVDDLLGALGPGGFAWLHDGAGFVTAGIAARVPPSEVGAALTSIEVDDPVCVEGSGALAVGALPFRDPLDGSLVIPARIQGVSRDGRAWVTEIGTSQQPVARGPEPSWYEIASVQGRERWSRNVDALLGAIAAGRLEKAVLAREVRVTADVPFDVVGVLSRLAAREAGCIVFASDGFVGATPELLVRRTGNTVVSRPMAGTVRRAATVEADRHAARELVASTKDGREHRLVVDAVVERLRATGVQVGPVPAPDVVRLPSVSHLATAISGRVNASDGPSALDLACALHPTPAVGGAPCDAALAALAELEGFDRGRYAGPVGWVNAARDGEWAVALRCAELDANQARLFAGAGIVAGSDPDAEWIETQAKLEAMLRALVQP
jgi:menaquinone-specific isochorismate synthase